ncbi:MAG: hypothetical protein MJZ98_03055 [Paludibacteraceae bacterium]|nr:hypothetical protein [Paludibacteraceae bacterium]
MKTLRYSIMAKLTLAVSMTIILFVSCSPEMEISGVDYYYRANKAVVYNDHLERPTEDLGGITDCYFANGNIYYIGTHVSKETRESQAFIEVNGSRKWYRLNNNDTKGAMIVPDDKDIYYILEETYETGDKNQLGDPHVGHSYYASKNGGEPEFIGHSPELIHDTKLPYITTIKRIDGQFYFTGIKDDVGFYSPAENLVLPFYVSGHGGAAFDIIKKDSVIYCCGRHNNTAYLFNKTELIELEIPERSEYSEARCMKVVGDDLYVGGMIDEVPVIWKNGEIWGRYDDFPPHYLHYYLKDVDKSLSPAVPNNGTPPNLDPALPMNYRAGSVINMEIFGDTIYSMIITRSNSTSQISGKHYDCRYFALEWYKSGDKVVCKDKYDIVEMMKLHTIEFDRAYYGTSDAGEETWTVWISDESASRWDLSYSRPRIAPRYVKAKRKK